MSRPRPEPVVQERRTRRQSGVMPVSARTPVAQLGERFSSAQCTVHAQALSALMTGVEIHGALAAAAVATCGRHADMCLVALPMTPSQPIALLAQPGAAMTLTTADSGASLGERESLALDALERASALVASGRAIWISDAGEPDAHATTHAPEAGFAGEAAGVAELCRSLGMRSAVVVPLVSRAGTGAWVWLRGAHKHPFLASDAALALEIAAAATRVCDWHRGRQALADELAHRDELASAALHELRRELGTLLLRLEQGDPQVETLDALAGKGRVRLRQAMAEAKRMGAVFDCVFEPSLLRSGRLGLSCGDMRLDAWAADWVARHAAEGAANGLALELGDTSEVVARCDRERFTRAADLLLAMVARVVKGSAVVSVGQSAAGARVRVLITAPVREPRHGARRAEELGLDRGVLLLLRESLEAQGGALDYHAIGRVHHELAIELPSPVCGAVRRRR